MHRRWSVAVVASGAAVSLALATAPAAHAVARVPLPPVIVASNLNNPRGLAFAAAGQLYVAEAGLGTGDAQSGVQDGVGPTGSVTVVRRPGSATPSQQKLISGLASVASGGQAIGADGVSVTRRAGHTAIMTILGESGDPASQLGKLLNVSATGQSTMLADVSATDLAWTDLHKNEAWAPAGQFPDANP
jgi:hypothetical protein